jgi:cation transport ATPase
MKPSESPRVKARSERNSNDHRCERSWDEFAQYFEPIVSAMTLATALAWSLSPAPCCRASQAG